MSRSVPPTHTQTANFYHSELKSCSSCQDSSSEGASDSDSEPLSCSGSYKYETILLYKSSSSLSSGVLPSTSKGEDEYGRIRQLELRLDSLSSDVWFFCNRYRFALDLSHTAVLYTTVPATCKKLAVRRFIPPHDVTSLPRPLRKCVAIADIA